MMLYPCWKHGYTPLRVAIIAFGALSTTLTDGGETAFVYALFAVVVAMAAQGVLSPLRSRAFLFLGYISYTLYLLHQFIGYVVIYKLERLGVDSTVAILMAALMMILLATGLSLTVERPGVALVRTFYRRIKTSRMRQPVGETISATQPATS